MIRILVAEDSPTARALLVALLSAESDMQVVGEARTGTEAVEMAERLRPDLVTMDVHMPGLDGLEATRLIMTRSPRPILVVSSAAETDVRLSLDATRAGALMAIAKPGAPMGNGPGVEERQLVNMVRALSHVKVVRRHGAAQSAAEPERLPTPAAFPRRHAPNGRAVRPEVLAIAASTGGPAALRAILSELPASYSAPILVVQHIARGFAGGLAHWLNGDSALDVRLAELGEPARAGVVYVAPDDRHLGVRRDAEGGMRIQLDVAAAIGTFRPSATYLFRSCAENVREGVLALILTGMGDDGVAGLRDVQLSGGRVIAQDEASSVIFGMPREAARAGVVNEVLPLDTIARRVRELSC